MDDQKLIDAIDGLKKSISKLTAIQTDSFNDDTSHDDISSLKGEMFELRKSIINLNVAINNLASEIKKR